MSNHFSTSVWSLVKFFVEKQLPGGFRCFTVQLVLAVTTRNLINHQLPTLTARSSSTPVSGRCAKHVIPTLLTKKSTSFDFDHHKGLVAVVSKISRKGIACGKIIVVKGYKGSYSLIYEWMSLPYI